MSLDSELERLAAQIRACRICVERPDGKPLPHEPRPVVVPSSTARILIAGQAPGTKVHATGIPFNDASGDRLRDWMGVTREEASQSLRVSFHAGTSENDLAACLNALARCVKGLREARR